MTRVADLGPLARLARCAMRAQLLVLVLRQRLRSSLSPIEIQTAGGGSVSYRDPTGRLIVYRGEITIETSSLMAQWLRQVELWGDLDHLPPGWAADLARLPVRDRSYPNLRRFELHYRFVDGPVPGIGYTMHHEELWHAESDGQVTVRRYRRFLDVAHDIESQVDDPPPQLADPAPTSPDEAVLIIDAPARDDPQADAFWRALARDAALTLHETREAAPAEWAVAAARRLHQRGQPVLWIGQPPPPPHQAWMPLQWRLRQTSDQPLRLAIDGTPFFDELLTPLLPPASTTG